MNTVFHTELSAGRWHMLSLLEQMANIGSEVGRAIKGKETQKSERAEMAAYRALELFDLSLNDPKLRGRLREIARAREVFADFFFRGKYVWINRRIITKVLYGFCHRGKKQSLCMNSFQPKPGQTDYTHIRYAPVVNCVLFHEGKRLLVKRSKELKFYPNVWNGISGFLDDGKDFEEKVKEEILEEAGVAKENIVSIRRGEIFHQDESKYGKTWIVHPVLVEVKTNAITLDWEAGEYRWLSIDEAKMLDLLPGFDEVLERVEKIITALSKVPYAHTI